MKGLYSVLQTKISGYFQEVGRKQKCVIVLCCDFCVIRCHWSKGESLIVST